MTISLDKDRRKPVKLKTKAKIAGLAAVAACAAAGSHQAAAAPSSPVLVSVSGNVATGARLASTYGWGPGSGEWSCLDDLWERESGWQDNIANKSSGAFGIAQALGHGGGAAVVSVVHYPDGSSASDVTVDEYPSYAANAGDATAQIEWGLSYISSTYGDPCSAWGHEEADGWY